MPDKSDARTTSEAVADSLSIYVGGGTQPRPGGFNAVFLHFYETQIDDPTILQVYGYSDSFSYSPGDRIDLCISATTQSCRVEIQRDGAEPETVYDEDGIACSMQPVPKHASVNGCRWGISHSIEVSNDWASGFYRVFFHVERDGQSVRHEHFFVVRPEGQAKRCNMLFIHSTCTWTAYNSWGGSCFYGGLQGPDQQDRSAVLSTQRPFERGMLWLPVGAPRIPLRETQPPGAAARYPNFEYAYLWGYAKFYAAASYATYQRPFLVWAEKNGYQFDHFTQHDLHFHGDLLNQYDCVVITGHDEYWSRKMREAIDKYVDKGGYVARFGGNFCWQIRLEDEGKTQVCHWGGDEDPVIGTDKEDLFTTGWEDLRLDWPGATTFGLNGFRGIYNGISAAAPRSAGGFTVYRPEHWAFAGTDLYYGDHFGGDSRIACYEVDGCEYTFENGLPMPTGKDGTPEGIKILGMTPATCGAEERGHDGSFQFVGKADTEITSLFLKGNAEADNQDAVFRGSGMMAHFHRGQGEVFNAATCEWVAGLIDRDPFTEQITRNVFDRASHR